MKRFLYRRGVNVLLSGLVMLALLGFLAGCKTPPNADDESDIPWNAPQPWEGSPMIPGLNER